MLDLESYGAEVKRTLDSIGAHDNLVVSREQLAARVSCSEHLDAVLDRLVNRNVVNRFAKCWYSLPVKLRVGMVPELAIQPVPGAGGVVAESFWGFKRTTVTHEPGEYFVVDSGENAAFDLLRLIHVLFGRIRLGGLRCDNHEWSSNSIAGVLTGCERYVLYAADTCLDARVLHVIASTVGDACD